MSKISPNQGTHEDTITIEGIGFGTANCQNDVKVGGYPCVVKTSSTTKITCKLDTKGDMKVGFRHLIVVNVKGRGFALQDIVSEKDRSFVLMPNIASLSPTRGSIKGATKLTIIGSGFSSEVSSNVILMNNINCIPTSFKYTEVICTTPSAKGPAISDMKLYVNGHKATCTGTCLYTYDANLTPKVTSVTPITIMTSGNTLSLSGSGFGTNKNVVTVTVGDIPCQIKTVANTAITCAVDGVYLGSNQVHVHVDNSGYADSAATVEGKANIASVTPADGSVNGGTELVIRGNGFKDKDTSVTVDNSPCQITKQTLADITCLTPAHAAGQVSAIVKVASTTYASQSFTYSTQKTPVVSTVSPAAGYIGDSVTITGSGFSSTKADNTVKIGDAVCDVSSSSGSQIVCTAGARPAGKVAVSVSVAGKGLATSSAQFEYSLSMTKVNPTEGILQLNLYICKRFLRHTMLSNSSSLTFIYMVKITNIELITKMKKL